MESVFQFADEFGPAKIIHITERSTGLKAVLVVDNVAAGPSIGGVRMAPASRSSSPIRAWMRRTRKD